MTHFTVLVATDDPGKIDDMMAPFDENDETCEDAKWDWWVIGGRWSGSFIIREGHEADVIQGDRPLSWGDADEEQQKMIAEKMNNRCDGGRKDHLDLDKMRADAAMHARKRHQEFRKVTEGTPEPLPWRTYTENISEGNGYTIQQARQEYHDQPRIKALKGTQFDDPFSPDPTEEYGVTEDLYAARAVAHAVAGYALLTHEGQWVAPGDMGWWGMSTDEQPDRDEYSRKVTAYIDGLPGDMWLIMVDAHI